jgi:hypothetical protein
MEEKTHWFSILATSMPTKSSWPHSSEFMLITSVPQWAAPPQLCRLFSFYTLIFGATLHISANAASTFPRLATLPEQKFYTEL